MQQITVMTVETTEFPGDFPWHFKTGSVKFNKQLGSLLVA